MFSFSCFRFKIELIKPRQDAIITKDIIRTGELHKSKLRFTRIFRGTDGSFYQDTDSTVYSNVMTESEQEIFIFLEKNFIDKIYFFL